jgi:hypothetical protein
MAASPERTVHCGDGVAWLRQASLSAACAVVTSLPDSSELALSFEEWERWFSDTAELACRQVAEGAVTLFFQTDVKRDGTWVDKAFLVERGARRAGAALLFHKVVCRAPPGTTTFGRPGFAHLLAFSRALKLPVERSSPDVLPRLGQMTWARAMGVSVCEAACRFLLDETPCRTVVDPFCGLGTVLAVANAMGMDAVGVERSRKRAARAALLQVDLARSRAGPAGTAWPGP